MLRKLLKYEFRSVGRQLVPLYIGVLGLAAINHFFWFAPSSLQNNSGLAEISPMFTTIPPMLTMIGYVAVCVALGVITLLLIIQRFYKGLLTEEGYLMFTLPCKSWQLIAAKGITASAMCLAAGVVGFLSILLMAMNLNDWRYFFGGFLDIRWGELFEIHALWPLYIVEAAVLLIVGIFSTVGHMYVSIAVGHLFKRHRIALSIIAYVLIEMAWSCIVVTSAQISNRFQWDWVFRQMSSMNDAAWSMHVFLLLLIGSQLVPAAIYFFSTNWILSHKLNLE